MKNNKNGITKILIEKFFRRDTYNFRKNDFSEDELSRHILKLHLGADFDIDCLISEIFSNREKKEQINSCEEKPLIEENVAIVKTIDKDISWNNFDANFDKLPKEICDIIAQNDLEDEKKYNLSKRNEALTTCFLPNKDKSVKTEKEKNFDIDFFDEWDEKNFEKYANIEKFGDERYGDAIYKTIEGLGEENECTYKVEQELFFTMDTESIKAGFVEISQAGYGILRDQFFNFSVNDPIIPQQIIKKHMLKAGDFLSARCNYSNEKHMNFVTSIISIKGHQTHMSYRTHYETLSRKPLIDVYKYDINSVKFGILKTMPLGEILKGGKYYIQGSMKDFEFSTKVNCFVNQFALDNKVNIKYFQINTMLEDTGVKGNYVENINIPFNTSANKISTIVDLVVNSCMRDIEDGTNNIIIFSDLSELVKVYNKVYSGTAMVDGMLPKTIDKIKDLMATSINAENGASITFIAFDRLNFSDTNKEIVKFEIMPYFNKCFKMD